MGVSLTELDWLLPVRLESNQQQSNSGFEALVTSKCIRGLATILKIIKIHLSCHKSFNYYVWVESQFGRFFFAARNKHI